MLKIYNTLKKIIERCDNLNYSFKNFENNIWKGARKTRLVIFCNNDGYEWNVSYNNFIYGKSKCPKCSNVAKINKDESLDIIHKVCKKRNYSFLSFLNDWKNTNSKLIIKCNKDDHIWYPSFKSLQQGTGCPKCSNNAIVDLNNAKKI